VKLEMNKKALSPLVATVLLVIFSLAIGTITMNWGKNYVEKINLQEQKEEPRTGTLIVNYRDIDTELKELQIRHILGEISQSQYLEQEARLIGRS
jgi:hypothetical protein